MILKSKEMSILNAVRALFGQGRGNGQKVSYNYRRGMEEYKKGNKRDAFEYFQKAVKENPKDAYSIMRMAEIIYEQTEKYGDALEFVNAALERFPEKDKKGRALALTLRSRIFQQLGKPYEAKKDLDEAILLNPSEAGLYFERGDWFYQAGKYEESDRDFRHAVALNPTNPAAYMGLGRNEEERGKYKEALAWFEQAMKFDPDNAQLYGLVAEYYFKLKDYNKAADNVVKAIELDRGNKSYRAQIFMIQLAKTAFEVIRAKLEIKILQGKDTYWYYCMGRIYQEVGQYARAIDYYKQTGDVGVYPLIADCFMQMFQFRRALPYMDRYLSARDGNGGDYEERALIKFMLADFDGAEQDYVRAVDAGMKDVSGCYLQLGRIKEVKGDYEGAEQAYTAGIAVNSENPAFFYERGDLFARHLQRPQEAERDFKRVLEMDTVADGGSLREYALAYFGRMEEAEDWVEKIIQHDPSDSAGYFRAACFYSTRRDERALGYLRTALEKGFKMFVFLDCFEATEYVRSLPEGRALIEEYRAKSGDDAEEEAERRLAEVTVEVPFSREGEMCKVGCKVNGLPLHFVFDTGASSVSISTVEATFMLKNGYLSREDVRGRQNYMTADGNISEGVVVNLRRIELGTLVLEDVAATVVGSQNAPLLLGQSVLGRLGKIEIDNERQALRITPWEE